MSADEAAAPVPREPLGTTHLVLVPSSVSHGPAMQIAMSASIAHLKPWLAWAEHNTFEQTLDYLDGSSRAWVARTAFSFTVFATGQVVGDIALRRTANNPVEANMGYWLAASAAGRGWGTEAAAAVLAFGFDTLALERQELRNDVRNVASQRVAEKIGMRREALARGGAHSGDAYLYGMKASDPRVDTGANPDAGRG